MKPDARHAADKAARSTPGTFGGPIRIALLVGVLALLQLAVAYEVRILAHLLDLLCRERLSAAQRIMLVGGLFGVGCLLVRMRHACKATYGVLETVFALAFAFETSAAWQASSGGNLLALGSTVYLVVRGLSNVKDGIEERARAPRADSRNPVIRFELALVGLWMGEPAEPSRSELVRASDRNGS